LARFVVACQREMEYEELDRQPLLEWLERKSGKRVVEKLWKPLLDSKFDGNYEDLPATYIWARTRRMGKTRDRSGRELLGWLQGGYQTLIDALETRVRQLGGEVAAATSVERIERGGLVVDGRFRAFDHVLCTLAPPQARSLLSPELAALTPSDHCRYLGVICLLLRTRSAISPYYHLNITDRRVPLTTIVQTTHVVDPDAVGGHLLYVSKYVDAAHADHERSSAEVEREYLAHARRIFPALRADEILSSVVQRARITEPVHFLGGASRLPDMFPAPGLALASTAHVYPEIVSGQAVTGVSDRVVAGILERLQRREGIAA
jgi:protoporphyrinogen oxidase